MYFNNLNAGTIERANLDGSERTKLVSGQSVPHAVRVDPERGHLYWPEYIGSGRIRRSNLDGTGLTTIVDELNLPSLLELDLAGGKLYWTNQGSDDIRRANLDGSDQETLVTGQVDPSGIALDIASGKMYWTNVSGGQIRRANLDGTEIETLITGLPGPAFISLDLRHLLGDFDGDGVLGVADIDQLTAAVQAGEFDASLDLNADGNVDSDDRRVWVTDLKATWFGDANLDGKFDTTDLVAALATGPYEDGIANNSTWASGDWDGDGDFTTADLITALADGGYEQGARASLHVVPEPTSLVMVIASLFALAIHSDGARGRA